MHNGVTPPTNMSLKAQLESARGLKKFRLVAMKGGVFHVILWRIRVR